MSRQNEASVIVPCNPTGPMVIAGLKELDAWSDDALREEIDGYEMARRVYKAMTSAADERDTMWDET